jgi:adhesin transport system membrane fusion protein
MAENRLDSLIESHPLPTWRRVAWVLVILVLAGLGWAFYADLDEVTVAEGHVVPQGDLKVIQHLEGGIIERINVREGSLVSQGDVLVQLDIASSGLNREELAIRLDGQMLIQARLRAESTGEDFHLPPDVAARRLEQADAQRNTFNARRRELMSTVSILNQQVKQREQEVKEIESRLRALNDRKSNIGASDGALRQQIRQKELEVNELTARKTALEQNLRLAEERFKLSAELLKDGLVPRIEHLQLEAEVSSLRGELDSIIQSIPRAGAAVAEIQGKLRADRRSIEGEIEALESSLPRLHSAVDEARQRAMETEDRFRRESREQLSEVTQTIAQIREESNVIGEKGARLEIKSPIDGIVKKLRYSTIGGVVKPGEPIMEIVPTSERLVVEAKLNPVDRGFVAEGQSARVKISTYDFIRYGALDGKVARVAPDASENEDGTPYFQVVIETGKSYLGEQEGQLPITPGMQATVDIHTGARSVVDFLIKPVLKMKSEAFRER